MGTLRTLGALVVLALVTSSLLAAELSSGSVAKLSPNMVRVQFWLQYHNGDEPTAPGWVERCPNCGNYHVNSAAEALTDQRPAEVPGILLSPTTVLLVDPLVHSRFVREITVVSGENRRAAEISGYADDNAGLMLTLKEPMPAAATLRFDAARPAPYFAVTYRPRWGQWTAQASPFGESTTLLESGASVIAAPAPALIVDSQGNPIGASVQADVPTEKWQGSPTDWVWLSAQQMKERLDAIAKVADATILRVTLNLRSPASGNANPMMMRGEDDAEATEMHVVGIALEGGKLLVLAELPPRTTARLERIRAFAADGKEVPAKFVASLSDYGAFIADLQQPLSGAKLSELMLPAARNVLLPCASIRIAGDKRVSWIGHTRFSELEPAWKEQIAPTRGFAPKDTFVFDRDGRLLVLPVSRRQPGAQQNRYYREGSTAVATTLAYLLPVLRDIPAHADASNTPLSEADEARLAWLGVELQELTPELAKEAGVSEQVGEERSGAIVSFVHPGSPAEKQGVKTGTILLRLRVPGQTRPIPVVAEDRDAGFGNFPWERLDEVPPEYMEQIPQPWPTAASALNQTLTEIGIGKTVTAEFFDNGQLVEKQFVLEESPRHFDSAPAAQVRPTGTYGTRANLRGPALLSSKP